MADPARRRAQNAAGPWFVDASCIDCGTCMWMAPHAFRDADGQSAVHVQPAADDGLAAAALVACPTASIGGPAGAGKLGAAAFPRQIAPNVWHCGFHDESSFGATSYLVKTTAGNVLVDAPRFATPIVKALEATGGVQQMVFTHRDDVGAHAKWHERFGAPRAVHEGDHIMDAEDILTGDGGFIGGLEWLHVPGHTRGHVVYKFGDVVFTGDHLAGSVRHPEQLRAFRDACWYSWSEQRKSMAKMADWEIRNVLPGHGAPWTGTPEQYRKAMASLMDWMGR